MIYKHPATYKGSEGRSENYQNMLRCIVEKYCLKCDDFIGKDHDFSECKDACCERHPHGFAVPRIDAEDFVKLPVEGVIHVVER